MAAAALLFVSVNVIKADEFEELYQQQVNQRSGNIARSEVDNTELTLSDAMALDTVSGKKKRLTDEGEKSLSMLDSLRMAKTLYYQIYQDLEETDATSSDTLAAARITKGAQSQGHSWSIGAGVDWIMKNADTQDNVTPMIVTGYRYDGRYMTFRTDVGMTTRKRHAEDLNTGKRYFAPFADFAVGVNIFDDLWVGGFNNHVVSVYATAGYLYDQHRSKLGVLVDDDKNLYETVEEHRASGFTFGFGLEYDWRMHATGNSLGIRLGAKHVPQSYVGRTIGQWELNASVIFNLGIKRNRFRD